MGKILLRYDVLDKMRVFIILVFPYSERILEDNFLIWFSIFSMVMSQFNLLAPFKFSWKYIRKILIVSNRFLIVICGV